MLTERTLSNVVLCSDCTSTTRQLYIYSNINIAQGVVSAKQNQEKICFQEPEYPGHYFRRHDYVFT